MKLASIALVIVALSFPALAQDRTPAPEGARVYVISPLNGATVSSPVTVVFGLEGMGVAPAEVEMVKTGHHHLIIDGDLPSLNERIPSGETYRHFSGGQTEVVVELAPGPHTLQMIMSDHNHVPHDPPVVSEKKSITVR
jgi:hypothetical protein